MSEQVPQYPGENIQHNPQHPLEGEYHDLQQLDEQSGQPINSADEGLLPKDVALEVAYAGKPERDEAHQIEVTVSQVKQFNSDARKRLNELSQAHQAERAQLEESHKVAGTFKTDSYYDAKDELNIVQRESSHSLESDTGAAATDFMLENANVMHDLLAKMHETELIQNLQILARNKNIEITDDTLDEQTGISLVGARKLLDKRSVEILEAIERNNNNVVGRSTEMHLSNADRIEMQAQILSQNPEVEDDIRKLVTEISGKPFEGVVKPELLQIALEQIAELEHKKRVWNSYRSSESIVQDGHDVIHSMGQSLRTFFGEGSTIYEGWKELQRSDDTTIGDLRSYYDKPLRDNLDLLDSRIIIFNEGLDSYFRAKEKLENS